MTVFISWERPRHWRVRLFTPGTRHSGGTHATLGIIADTGHRAMVAAQEAMPAARIESCNDIGGIDIVVDSPKENV